MKLNVLTDRISPKLEQIFRLLFLMLAFLNFNGFTYGTPLRETFVVLTTAAAGLALLCRFYRAGDYLRNGILLLLIAFMLSFCVTAVLHREYGLVSPVKMLTWIGMQVLLLFAVDTKATFEQVKRDCMPVMYLFLLIVAVSALISLGFLVTGFRYVRIYENTWGREPIMAGMFWGRLWGVYTDPNYGSVMAIAALYFSVYLMFVKRHRLLRIALGVNIAIQLLYIAFSGSRTGLVALVISVFFLAMFLALSKVGQTAVWHKKALCVGVAVLIAVGCLAAPTVIVKGYNGILSVIHTAPPTSDGTSDSDPTEPSQKPSDTLNDLLVGRQDEEFISDDISNNRFNLWGSALDFVKAEPLFGVPFVYLVQYARDHLPETFLIHNNRGTFNNFHNSLFNILGGQGIIGFILFMVAAVWAGIRAVKCVVNRLYTSDAVFCSVAFAVVVAVLVSAMFLTELVYTQSPNTVLFWLLCGILVHGGKGDRTADA